MVAHRELHGLGPAYLRKRFEFYTPTRDLRSASQFLARIPRVQRQRLGGRSLAFRAATVWNLLPFSLRSIHDISVFKKQLKTFLF